MVPKIYLSDAGPKISQAVYGFWRWDEAAASDAARMERIINLCLELGINTFDHADTYGAYQAERQFGTVMSRGAFKREDVVLFSKIGDCRPHPARPEYKVRHTNTSAAHITQGVEQSLRNLQTDHLDILLLDGLDPLSNLEETALAIERLKTAGKLRHIGIANFSVFQHQLLASYLHIPIVTNYINLNLLNTAALDNGQLDYIRQRYMRALAAEPLAGGRIEHGEDEQAQRVREVLRQLAKRYDTHIESLAVAWINRLDAIPLIGTLNEQRIRNIAASFRIALEHQDWYELYHAARGE